MENILVNPLIRACAAFGAVFCLLLSFAGVIDIAVNYVDIWASLWTLAKVILVVYIAWCFWIVFKFGKNPFHITPFSKR
ncbi:hypothetical protein [Thalassotalea fusca]